jgi:hypothetical protein
VTLAPWDTGSGQSIDAFKPDQVPGASGPLGTHPGTTVSSDGGRDVAPPPASGGVDSGMGGLY